MHVLISTEQDIFSEHFNSIDSWDIADIPWELRTDPLYSDFWEINYTFWLGSSQDKTRWALTAISFFQKADKNEGYSSETLRAGCNVILVDPPSIREDSIARILFLVFNEIRKNGQISQQMIDQILSDVPFKVYHPAKAYMQELPTDWLNLPVDLCLNFSLLECGCVTPGLFREYHRDTIKGALEALCQEELWFVKIHYNVVVKEVIPFLAWDVDWPLSRREKNPPERRGKVGGALPWEYHANPTLLSIYQGPGRPYFGSSTVRLRVGGRSQGEAISNWQQCAKALRRIRPIKIKNV